MRSSRASSKSTPKVDTSTTHPGKQTKYSFEEFKLYYESTERVTDRRIASNNLNYSICVAVLIGIGFLWNWSIDNPSYSYLSLTLVWVLAVVAALYTRLWLAQIKGYKQLNAAKFDVLNKMAPNIVFSDQLSNLDIEVISYNPFQKEWEEMEKLGGLQKKKRFNIIALSSSNQEYFIPQSFLGIFLLIMFIAFLSILLHVNFFVIQWENFL